ncbi:MAG: tungstate ABC transporter substrate-binding protein WtpA, partial [Methanocalculus sp.]|uniref:tungstate ABC transporter substrate-binding protein WtpA n=2 Tax=Methanocalculus sp. TaxID=2004547 RepID=UPI002715B305
MRALFLFTILLLLVSGCTEVQPDQVTVRVVSAGSMLLPLEEIEEAYEILHPEIDIQTEGHGSIQAIRQVTDLNRQFDLVIVADQSLIPDMMYRQMSDRVDNYTNWFVPFATNHMVIAYTDRSAYADEITSGNWHLILSKPDVHIGFSNPMLDACGYRALMVASLAEGYYNNDLLFEQMIGDHLTPQPVIVHTGDSTLITLPEILHPSGDKVSIRSGSIYLLALLDAGGIDYAFEYESVARDHGLRWINLPPEIDLSDEAYRDQYNNVQVNLGYQRFESVGNLRTGEPIVYAATIPTTAQ